MPRPVSHSASSASRRRPPRRSICSARSGASSASRASRCARRARGARSRGSRRSPARRSSKILELKPDWCSASPTCRPTSRAELVARRHRSARLQPSQRRRRSCAMIAHARRAWSAARRRRAALVAATASRARRGARARGAFCAAAARVLRGVGRAADLAASAGCRSWSASPAATTAFPSCARAARASNRIIADPLEVLRRAPDIMLGSWCGKKFRPERVAARAGMEDDARGARRPAATRSSRRSSCSRGRRR